MASQSQQKGKLAENQARELLSKKGYTFLTQNFSSKYGEIDLIFLDADQVVFVEVKARKKGSMIHPLEAITPAKLEKIIITAQYFLQENPTIPQSGRIDAISIIGEGDNSDIAHHQNISQI